MSGVVSLEYLDIVRFYLFGEVRFLDLLLLLMALDILSGIFNAVRCGNLWSRKSLFGYARKVLVLIVIVLANVLDQILSLNGLLAHTTVLFYIANEGLSITENAAKLGVPLPDKILHMLKDMEANPTDEDSFKVEVQEELAGTEVNNELEYHDKTKK